MDEFRLRLGGQVNKFVEQAQSVDKLDRELVVERDRALRLQLASRRLRKGTDDLASELELILRHQDEMHLALSELERRVEEEGKAFPDRPSERQQAYLLVEDLDKKLGDTRALLGDSIARLNSSRGGDEGGGDGMGGGGVGGGIGGGGGGDPAARVVRVLDVHLNAFQYLESHASRLDAALSQADALLGGAQRPGGSSAMYY